MARYVTALCLRSPSSTYGKSPLSPFPFFHRRISPNIIFLLNTSLFPLKSGLKKQAQIKTLKIKLAIFRILERAPEIFLATFRPFLSRARCCLDGRRWRRKKRKRILVSNRLKKWGGGGRRVLLLLVQER